MLESVSQIFQIAAAKYLSAVDAEPGRSNQHEIGGLPSVGFREFLGSPGKDSENRFSCLMAYVPDEDSPAVTAEVTVTWYDSRRHKAHRGPEYRLYYPGNAVTENIREGDLLVAAGRRDGSLVLIFAPPDSTIEIHLRHLFGLADLGTRLVAAELPEDNLLLPLRLLLEELGISALDTVQAERDLDILLARFPDQFPKTKELSALARELSGHDPVAAPDEALIGWMNREEALFRAYERHVVADRLRKGFGEDGADVDAFIEFSLSVHGRRKSRMGHALENQLTDIFAMNQLTFEKGSRSRVTENGAQPDFLFPGFDAYYNPDYSKERLFLLGAKTTCKDRWRQVLSEGQRLERKYLATLEPGISKAQTDEMKANGVQLIVPSPIHSTYSTSQQEWLMGLRSFIGMVSSTQ